MIRLLFIISTLVIIPMCVRGVQLRRMMPSSIGDARRGLWQTNSELPYVWITVDNIPLGTHDGLTITTWIRVVRYNGSSLGMYSTWCPYEIDKFNPDLLSGLGGYGNSAEIDLTALGGTKSFASITFSPYSIAGVPQLDTHYWPNGVATVAGESEQTITISVGGSDVNVGPGPFNRNVEAGPANNVIISGSGKCQVGISKTPCYQFFDHVSGSLGGSGSGFLDPAGVVSNAWAMLTYRWKCTPEGNQVCRTDLGRLYAFNSDTSVYTNMTGYVTGYSSKGLYKIGLLAMIFAPPFDIELFDVRTFGYWLSQENLERIHANGVEEIYRRWPGTQAQ